MQRFDLTPHYFHRFVSSHEQLYLSLVPGRVPRPFNYKILFKRSISSQQSATLFGTAVSSKKMPLLMDLL